MFQSKPAMGRLVWLVSMLFICNTAFSQATLSLQGILKKSDGTAVADGDYSLTFNIYSATSGGTSLWSETQPVVELSGGIYSVILGSVTPLTIPFNQTYFVGIRVGSAIEMTPRVQLTASPYAFSLIGQSNAFPSTGAVGIGTSSPSSSSTLHLKGAAPTILFENSSAAVASIKFDNSNIEFRRGTNKWLTVDSDGADILGSLFIGDNGGSQIASFGSDITFNKGLTISGTTTATVASFLWLKDNGGCSFNTGCPSGSQTKPYAINTGNRQILCGEINIFSDQRLKKDFKLSNISDDLATLRRLRVTDYRYKDEEANGSGFKKGLIAQEVEEVFPEAVKVAAPTFLPDVLAFSSAASLDGSKLTVKMDAQHGFSIGDKVKILDEKGAQEVLVSAVGDDRSFTVEGWNGSRDVSQLFVYGKESSDVRAVDFERISALNVAATQALAQKVADLESENAALRAKNGDLQGSIEKMDGRMRAIEAKLTN